MFIKLITHSFTFNFLKCISHSYFTFQLHKFHNTLWYSKFQKMDQDFSITAAMKSKASTFLKVLWIIVLCCSICCLGYYVNENYIKLNVDPEILVKAEYINSRTIPFPAITICPPNVVNIEFLNISQFFNDLKNGKIPDDEDKKIMTAASHVCFQHLKLLRSMKSGIYDDKNIAQTLKKVSPKLDKVLVKCGLRKPTECTKIFIQSLTFLGSCFTFNMQGYHTIFNSNISADFDVYKRKNITKSWDPIAKAEFHDDDADEIEPLQWTTEDGYSTNEDWTQPLRSSGMQYLTTSAKVESKQLPNFCDDNYKSYRIILHLPNEVPTFSNVHSIFMLGKLKLMRIHASLSKIDDNLRNFPPEQRKCYYKDERQLKYFKSYTKLNCEHECMADFTLKTCGCVSFSMPRADGMKVCQFKDNGCYSNIYYQWSKSYYEDLENVRKYPDFPCNCWPTCTKIKYSIVNDFHMDPDVYR